jgi:hypothetical protein
MINKPGLLTLIAVVTAMIGCSRLQGSKTSSDLPLSLFTAGDDSLIPAGDKLSDDCRNQSDFDTCLFLKNPVAQEGRAVNTNEIEGARHFGVKIRGLAKTGSLENAHFKILTLNTPRFSLLNPSAFKAPFAPGASYAEQLSAYYWADRAFEYLGGRVGSARLPTSPLSIYADDVFTGLSTKNASIHLGKSESGMPAAFSAEIVIHLLGEATAQSLSGRRLFPVDPAQHNSCYLNPRGCCRTDAGCAQALASGFGDYTAAIMFPGSPKLGEASAEDPVGQSLCGLPRDLAAMATRSKGDVFSACAKAPGQAVLLGAWYAGQWWHLRQQVEAETPGAAADIDILFFEHAKVWTGSATFSQAKAAAIAAATSYKNGLYKDRVSAALSAL